LDVKAANVPRALTNATYRYQSFSEFAATFEPYLGLPIKVTVYLEREGLGWKLTRVKRLQ
jgi:hypothetical protein